MHETPQIVSTTYASNTAGYEQDHHGFRRVQVGAPVDFNQGADVFKHVRQKIDEAVGHDIGDEVMSDKRMVRVLIVDPDEAVPVDKSVLHDSKEKLTDLTDQELFFEVDLKEALDKHNEYRATIVDKEVKDRTEHLEPLRIRDLKMLVVTLAEF